MAARTKRSELLALGVVLAAVLAVWLVNGGDPGTPTSSGEVISSDTADFGVDDADPDETSYEAGPGGRLPVVQLDDLPSEAAATVELVDDGGPFPEDEDGGTFHNFERLLPDRERGYYQEYTVPTPGSDDRGARRMVVGAGGELYWTADHYRSFARVER